MYERLSRVHTHKQHYLKVISVCMLIGLVVYYMSFLYAEDRHVVGEGYEEDAHSTHQDFCTPETYNNGQWIHKPLTINTLTEAELAKAAGYYCMKKFAHRCFRRINEPNELKRAKKIIDYTWQPNQCTLLKLDTKSLANHFMKHPILFIGDSITQLQFESMACLLGQHLPSRHVMDSTLNGGNSKIKAQEVSANNSNHTAVGFLRSDYLLRLDDFKIIEPFDPVGNQLGTGENYPWAHALSSFDYIVLNTGPHWHPNVFWGPDASEDDMLMAYQTSMQIVYDYLSNHMTSNQRVWIRTTPYGHAQCSQYDQPQNTPLEPTGQQGEYEWHLFAKFDAIWKAIIMHGDNDRISVFDISMISNKRGDAHSKPDRDCLHTCLPGPVDEWNKLLYHEIMKGTQPEVDF